MHFDRRTFLACTTAALLRPAFAADARANPFTLGVASGYPTSASVVLWTRLAPERTMWGATQEAWLGLQLKESRARWNLIAQGTPMAWMDQEPGDETQYWTDSWTGYPAARRARRKVRCSYRN